MLRLRRANFQMNPSTTSAMYAYPAASKAIPAGPATPLAAGVLPKRVANARYARVEVRESGRRVVDLRVPISLGRFALRRVPGLSSQQIADVEEAVTSGAHGPILDVQDADGDGVRIILE